MAGPQDIQRFPKGLIDLLGMRATGDTPNQLGQLTQPMLSIKDEYLLDRCQIRTWDFGAVITVQGNTILANSGPGPGFQWYVYGISGALGGTIAAAATLQLGLGINRGPVLGNAILLPGCVSGVLATGSNFYFANQSVPPLIMRPGDSLSMNVAVVTGAPGVQPSGRIYFAEVGV
jgi:hypothetical protein